MSKKQFRIGMQVLAVLLVLVITLSAYAVGKYTTKIEFDGSVTFTSSLATNMTLQEHEAIRQPDGSYDLDEATVSGNSYILIPGVDIPKDPHIIIEGKTTIPAYLYIIVEEDSTDAAVSYQLQDCWKRLSDLDSKAASNVYVYCTEDANGQMIPAVLTSTPGQIDILKEDTEGNTVFVGQNLLAGDAATDVLTIRALLKERVGDNDAVKTYG